MFNELYLIGDQSRLLVKNIIKEFQDIGCKINNIAPTDADLDKLPAKPIQLVVLLTDDFTFSLIKKIGTFQRIHNYHICFIGQPAKLSMAESKYFNQLPSIKVKSLNFNIGELLELMEKNESTRKHILVVDDEPIILRSIKTWLGDTFDLSLVNSGETALQFLDMHPVDLVLLDYKMPIMDGPQVLATIRKDERLKNLPVIFLTANNDRQSVMNAMLYKPDGYLLKNKSPEEIKQCVTDFFKNRVINM